MHNSESTASAREEAVPRTDGGESVNETDPELPDAVVADLRKSRRRRLALEHLREREGAIPIADLARVVAAAEAETTVDDVSEEAVDTVRRSLFQDHLPKLTATGVVRYNSLVGTVTLDASDERLFGDDPPSHLDSADAE